VPVAATHELGLLAAAQAGDRRALTELVTAYLPLVYSTVRRGLGGVPDVDDVVQETMLRVLRELRALRTPESFRPWLMAIVMRQVSTFRRRWWAAADRTVALDEVLDVSVAAAEDLALLRLELSDQRRRLARASRWLDPDDVVPLSLWWLESAGRLTRTELASALGKSVAHAAVCVQRARDRLNLSRSVVAALDAVPRCGGLVATLDGWDGAPGPLWRKRILRHVRACPACGSASTRLLPPELLFEYLALLPENCYLQGCPESDDGCGTQTENDTKHR
jgi:RNA polymerase sigma factor (sigma-70 family)